MLDAHHAVLHRPGLWSTWPGVKPWWRASCWATAFLGLGVGFILWARDLLPGHDVIASRGHHDVSAGEDRQAVTESLSRGVEVMARRPFLYKFLGAVGGVFGLAALFPLASLGPRPHTRPRTTLAGARAPGP